MGRREPDKRVGIRQTSPGMRGLVEHFEVQRIFLSFNNVWCLLSDGTCFYIKSVPFLLSSRHLLLTATHKILILSLRGGNPLGIVPQAAWGRSLESLPERLFTIRSVFSVFFFSFSFVLVVWCLCALLRTRKGCLVWIILLFWASN